MQSNDRTDGTNFREVIIIGSGPAGYTAAMYAARAQLNPLVIEGVESGGALVTTSGVENYPGIPDAILGPDLMGRLRKQAERFGAGFLANDVTRVELAGDTKVVHVGDLAYRSHAVILAMGSSWRALNVPGERGLLGHGVSTCATCDGFFFRNQRVVVVGGGDHAIEEATFLTRFAAKVTIVNHGSEFRACKIMTNRVLDNPKIDILWDTTVDEILSADGAVSGVKIRNSLPVGSRQIAASGVFIAIGHDPRSELVRGQVDVDQDGYVLVTASTCRTNLAGVFACGDLVDRAYRQAITAAGTGCAAAIDAERYLTARNPAAAAWSLPSLA